MVATPSGGEFNRFDRDGDYFEGNPQLIDVGAAKGAFLEYINAEFGGHIAGIRLNGNDLEFEDVTNGVGNWIPLSALTGHLGDIHYVVPTPGQFVFNLPFAYVVGSNTLQVELVGVSRIPGPGAPTPVFAETSPTVVTFLSGPGGIAPWTPFLGTELLIFYVPGRPIVNDTYLVKVDAADTPDYLENQVEDAGAAQAATVAKVTGKMQVSVPLTSTTPAASTGAGAVGSEVTPARGDHVHPAPVAILGSSTPLVESGAGSVGVATVASREDHVHPLGPVTPLGSATPLIESGAGSAGVSTNASREDHVHPASGGAGAATYLYEEQNHPGGAGPTHLITLATGAYVVGNGELNVIVGGVVVPRSNIQELTTITFNIINWGPIAAGTKVVALVPKAVAVTGLTNALYEIQTAAGGQTVFNLTTGTYRPGFNELIVVIGTSFIQNTAYTENSPTQVTMKAPGAGGPPAIPAGTPVLFMVPQGAVSGGEAFLGEDSFKGSLLDAPLGISSDFFNVTYPVGTKEIELGVYTDSSAGAFVNRYVGKAVIDVAGNKLTMMANASSAATPLVNVTLNPIAVPTKLLDISVVPNTYYLSIQAWNPATRTLTFRLTIAPGGAGTVTVEAGVFAVYRG